MLEDKEIFLAALQDLIYYEETLNQEGKDDCLLSAIIVLANEMIRLNCPRLHDEYGFTFVDIDDRYGELLNEISVKLVVKFYDAWQKWAQMDL